jgi:hypothetical protein
MKLLDLKYFLIKRNNQVQGFVSFMPTYEDDYPVIYCYEIHLSPTLQGYVHTLICSTIHVIDATQYGPGNGSDAAA